MNHDTATRQPASAGLADAGEAPAADPVITIVTRTPARARSQNA
jgi:hypothetical protein